MITKLDNYKLLKTIKDHLKKIPESDLDITRLASIIGLEYMTMINLEGHLNGSFDFFEQNKDYYKDFKNIINREIADYENSDEYNGLLEDDRMSKQEMQDDE